MNYDIEVFLIPAHDDFPERWGYNVGHIHQEWLPDVEGFVPMTEEEARANAEIILTRLQG